MKGVYFLADDAVIDWTVAMLASLRRHEPALPVVWIPFGGSDAQLRRLLAVYDVDVVGEDLHLAQWEEVGRELYPDNPIGARLFKKLAVFDGPFDEFIFIDCDVVLRASLSWAFQALEDSQAQVAFYDEDLDSVYIDPTLQRTMVERHGSRGWNTGFWAGRHGALSLDLARQVMPEALEARTGFAATGEQPFFNFVLDLGRVRTASLQHHAGSKWAHSLLVGGERGDDSAGRPALHWAGMSRPSLTMPLGGTWLRHRLTARRPLLLSKLITAMIIRPAVRAVRGLVR